MGLSKNPVRTTSGPVPMGQRKEGLYHEILRNILKRLDPKNWGNTIEQDPCAEFSFHVRMLGGERRRKHPSLSLSSPAFEMRQGLKKRGVGLAPLAARRDVACHLTSTPKDLLLSRNKDIWQILRRVKEEVAGVTAGEEDQHRASGF